MSDSPDRESMWSTPFENKCFDEWEKDCVLEDRVHADTDVCDQKIWLSFQNCASAISQLYKEGSHPNSVQLWVPFQVAAGAATVLYKDSQEMMRRSFELGTQLGGHRRTKEVLAWLRKRRRNLMREDVVSFVSGRPAAPARPQTHGRSSFSRAAGRYASFEPSSPRCSPSSRAGVFYPGETSAGMNGFKDLPNFQGPINVASNSSSVYRRSSQTNSPLRVTPPLRNSYHLEDSRTAVFEEPYSACFSGSRKRTASGDPRGGSNSPSVAFKRNRMDTDEN